MKYFLLLAFLTFRLSFTFAQQKAECKDNRMHSALVTLNQSFEKQGMHVLQFSVLNIPAKAYVPVAVSLKQGKMYQINYIVQPEFQNYSMILIDKEKNELIKLKIKSKNTDEHFSTQSFVAPYSGDYWVILTQKVKGSDGACAGFSILETGN